jgi:nitrate reductase cytochrome c-type subunit
MIKFFCAAIVATAFTAQSAQAGDCCCSDQATASADHQAKAADQTQQAQANSQNRSFSYEPAEVPAAVRRVEQNSGFYAGSMYNEPRIIGSYGHRPASDKTIGNY